MKSPNGQVYKIQENVRVHRDVNRVLTLVTAMPRCVLL